MRASLKEIMAYLEYLLENKHVTQQCVCIEGSFWGLIHQMFEHSRVRYFLKSVKINRPLCHVRRNITTLNMLTSLIRECGFRAIFLSQFFICHTNIRHYCVRSLL